MDEEGDHPVVEETTKELCVVPGYSDVNKFTQRALQCFLQATKKSNDLPMAGDDFDYFSSFSNFQELMNVEGQRILHMMQNMLRYASVRGDRSLTSESLDRDDKFDYLTDANDQILERISNSLDEAAGIRKEEKLIMVKTTKPGTSASWNKQSGPTKPRNYSLFTARNIERPQLKFTDSVKNDNHPFCPSLREKPNALKSLTESMKLPEDITDEKLSSPFFEYPHPYHYELELFEPPPSQLETTTPTMPPSCSDSPPVVMVSTVSQLKEVIEVLMKQTSIAVDLEHHSYRSYLGFTCLVQISTTHHDYLIDAIQLRSELHRLNHVFTDPSILKVFHGADCDVEWLQRDLGVYVVNLFDTGIAARLLNCARLSLGHLLETYCGVHANKQYQLADWRIRPLPTELVTYAREDTHYLLYIQDCMRNELITRSNANDNLILSLYRRSTQLCLKKYNKPIMTEQSHLDFYKRSRKVFNSQQLYALQLIFAWRDEVARTEDESTGYVLPSHMLLQMSEILPREQTGVLACCNPVPPLVRQSLNEIHAIIVRARDVALVSTQIPNHSSPAKTMTSPAAINDLINRRHDDTPRPPAFELADNEVNNERSTETVLSFGAKLLLKPSPMFVALATTKSTCKKWSRRLSASIRESFVSPFTMYLPITEKTVIKPQKLVAPVAMETVIESPPLSSLPWKLKKSSKKRKSEETMGKKTSEEVVTMSGETVQANVEAEEDGVVSLSQMLPHKKKKKKIDWIGVAAATEDNEENDTSVDFLGDTPARNKKPGAGSATKARVRSEKKGKIGPKMGSVEPDAVTPFDYGQTDMSMFSSAKDRAKAFDPRNESKKNKKGRKFGNFKKDFKSKGFRLKMKKPND